MIQVKISLALALALILALALAVVVRILMGEIVVVMTATTAAGIARFGFLHGFS
ncbi:hypothetical protein Q5688_25500 [Microcoleus sp. herbarium5]